MAKLSDRRSGGLTPLPLWRDADALMCEFVPGHRLSDELARDPGCSGPLSDAPAQPWLRYTSSVSRTWTLHSPMSSPRKKEPGVD